ncbi:hypothetical protein [Actinomyces vulturis]|uniref:hypothetical protein n=1 Tax=Actinomyces vulturis TaxID=1857645 RepID=UPI00082D0127|nr:hypothetical protein [Actinomyces vulturis]
MTPVSHRRIGRILTALILPGFIVIGAILNIVGTPAFADETPAPTPTATIAPTPSMEGIPAEEGKMPNPIDMQGWVRDFCGVDDDVIILKDLPGVVYSQNGEFVTGEVPMTNGDYVLITANEGADGVKQMVVMRDQLALTNEPCDAPDAIIPESKQNNNGISGPGWIPAIIAAIVGLGVGVGAFAWKERKAGTKKKHHLD